MVANPFLIEGPALISFSGGRTSAFMLKLILEAHGGVLPPDVHVAFANTGKEREETLRFVHECGSRWGVLVHWVEWRPTPSRAAGTAALASWLDVNDPLRLMVAAEGFERVGFNSASRRGEPFAALIAMKQRLPNWQERWCTEFLKVATLSALAKSLGLIEGAYREIIGLRHDEFHRVLRSLANAQFRWDRKLKKEVPRDPPRLVLHPLAKAKITKADVSAFWREQAFDLQLQPHEGNCDLCFMKGRQIRKRIIRDVPGVAPWWDQAERVNDGFFDRRDRVRDLVGEVRKAPGFFDEADLGEHDVECGLACAPFPVEDAA